MNNAATSRITPSRSLKNGLLVRWMDPPAFFEPVVARTIRATAGLKNGGARKPWMAESPKNSASAEFFNKPLKVVGKSYQTGFVRRISRCSDFSHRRFAHIHSSGCSRIHCSINAFNRVVTAIAFACSSSPSSGIRGHRRIDEHAKTRLTEPFRAHGNDVATVAAAPSAPVSAT